jgi:hypothetical protein
MLLTLAQPAIGATASFESAAMFRAQAEEAGKVAVTAETPDYTCSKTKPCALGCCGPL